MALIILYLSGYLNSHSPFPVYKYMNFLFLYFFTKFEFYILHFQKKYANIYLELAQIAQLVEQRTENPRVTGSIPVLGIFLWYGILAQSVEHLTFNQVVGGSNPPCLSKKT